MYTCITFNPYILWWVLTFIKPFLTTLQVFESIFSTLSLLVLKRCQAPTRVLESNVELEKARMLIPIMQAAIQPLMSSSAAVGNNY